MLGKLSLGEHVVGKISEYQTVGLDDIIGEPVTVVGVSIGTRTDASGREYAQTILRLDDGRMVRSASAVVADTFGAVPEDAYPIGPVVFRKNASSVKGHSDFITVEDA